MTDLYRLPNPDFDSQLVTLLFEIERMRVDLGRGDTPEGVFKELHFLFSTMMSVISARIEGNHTTIYEALESTEDPQHQRPDERFQEIANLWSASQFIDSLDPGAPLTHQLVRELHARVVEGLTVEGDATPGRYREVEVGITDPTHTPPSWVYLHAEMTALLDFSNSDLPLNKQMLQIAIAHHRFVWIHPFQNGNGRVSRLFTYAMLRRSIFSGESHSALNPTSVFGNNRDDYITALTRADALSDDGTVEWATFFCRGIRTDLERMILLRQKNFVFSELVEPAIDSLLRRGVISAETGAAIQATLHAGTVKAGDLAEAIPGSPSQRSRRISNLVDRNLLRQSDRGPRFYEVSLAHGPLARALIEQLDLLGFLPRLLADD